MKPGIHFSYLPSPVGRLLIAGDSSGLRRIVFESERKPQSPAPGWIEGGKPLAEAIEQLEAYFAGALQRFDLRLAAQGTPFQLRVWAALREIPYGATISYGELARRIGRPGAARAVGAANGQNPIPIVVPCHRVIGSNGNLVGFGGGLAVKRRLLALERTAASLPQPSLWAGDRAWHGARST